MNPWSAKRLPLCNTSQLLQLAGRSASGKTNSEQATSTSHAAAISSGSHHARRARPCPPAPGAAKLVADSGELASDTAWAVTTVHCGGAIDEPTRSAARAIGGRRLQPDRTEAAPVHQLEIPESVHFSPASAHGREQRANRARSGIRCAHELARRRRSRAVLR